MSLIAPSPLARFVAVAIVGALAVFATARSGAADVPKGAVIVARSAPTALLIWDASSAVADLVVARNASDASTRTLEVEAIQILVARAPQLRARRVELRVQYAPIGVEGVAYQASTFANATPLLLLSTDRAMIATRHDAWIADIRDGRSPSGLSVKSLGAFPQTQ